MKKIASLVGILLALSSVFPLYRFCHTQTDGFTPRKIRKAFTSQNVPHCSSTLSEEEKALVEKILLEPLHYLGRGGQCYAFSTPDDKYVVKLLKHNNNYPKIWFRLIPFPFGYETKRKEKIAFKFGKLKKEYLSYEIALKNLIQETGILYMHLDAETLPGVTIKLFDKIKVVHYLKADQFQFYIQKKGTPLYPGFEEMLQKGRIDLAQIALDEIAQFLIKRCTKKIIDKDDGIWRNFAFYDGHPFQIDIGQFTYDSSMITEEDFEINLMAFTRDFRNWLSSIDPSLEQHFKKALHFDAHETMP